MLREPDDTPQVAVRYDRATGIELMIWRRGNREVEVIQITRRKALAMAHELLGHSLSIDQSPS